MPVLWLGEAIDALNDEMGWPLSAVATSQSCQLSRQVLRSTLRLLLWRQIVRLGAYVPVRSLRG